MLFSSANYIFIFFPVVFIMFFLLGRLKRREVADIFLVLASLFFYFVGSRWYIFVFLFSILVNYVIGKALSAMPDEQKSVKKLVLATAVIMNVAILAGFKYYDYLIAGLRRVVSSNIPLLNIVMPIGLSFFTFIIIAYQVDCYKGKVKDIKFLEYLVFVSFFPQLLMGPISRQSEILPQIRDEKRYKINWDNISRGFCIFALGLGQKVILATPLTSMASAMINNAKPNPVFGILGMFACLFSVYFDFAGYVNMALGSARMLNITLPENLNSPLKARNIQDYWQRRHITLTRFFTEFVFRNIYNPIYGIGSFCFATMVTFLVSGLWHGNGLIFVFWGLCHGVLVSLVGVTSILTSKKHLVPKIVGQIFTTLALLVLSGVFSAKSLSGYITFLKGTVNFASLSDPNMIATITNYLVRNPYPIFIMIIAFFVAYVLKYNSKELADRYLKKPWFTIICGIIFVFGIMMMGQTSTFMYFRF